MNEYVVEVKMPIVFEKYQDKFKALMNEFLDRPGLTFEKFGSIKSRDEEFNILGDPLLRICTIDIKNRLPSIIEDIDMCDTEQFQCFIKILTPEILCNNGFFYPRCFMLPNGEPAKILAIDYIYNDGGKIK